MRVTFDLETTNVRSGVATEPANRIVLSAWKVNHAPAQWGLGFPQELHDLILQAAAERWELVAHHCKFEAGWLIREMAVWLHVDELKWQDPMLAEWVLLGNNPYRRSISLDACAERYGLARKERFIDSLMRGGVCPSKHPRALLAARCILDVETTYALHMAQQAKLQERGRETAALVELRCMVAPLLAKAEAAAAANVWKLDGTKVSAATEQAQAAEATALAEMRTQAQPLTAHQFDPAGSQDMAEVLFGERKLKRRSKNKQEYFEPVPERFGLRLGFPAPDPRNRRDPTKLWPAGAPLLNADVMEALHAVCVTPQQAQFLDHYISAREARSLLDKNLAFYNLCLAERGGHYLIEISQGRTATHRLAAQGVSVVFSDGTELGPQEQNIPRALKGLTCPTDPDMAALSADAKQLEFRAAAELCGDEQAKADIRDPDFDAHIQTLALLKYGSREAYPELLARYRAGDKQIAWERNDNSTCKAHTYKPLFGGEKGTAAQERYYRYFRERYAGIAAAQRAWQRQVLLRGFHDHLGMRFTYDVRMRRGLLWDSIKGKPAGPAISNHPIQRFATGEMMASAFVNSARRLCPLGGIITGTVHDSVRAAIPRAAVQECADAVAIAFTTDVREWLRTAHSLEWSTPLGVDISIGSHFDTHNILARSAEG
jgi:hypothetical protein